MPTEHTWGRDGPAATHHVCGGCGKRVTVRPDQCGRRLRCPACSTAFVVPPPRAVPPRPSHQPLDGQEDAPAAEAGELAAVSSGGGTAGPVGGTEFATARFSQPPAVVFDATVYAVRRAGGEVRALDRANRNVRFAVGGGALYGEHTAYVFPGPAGGSELDVRPVVSAGAMADRLLYGRVGVELLAYLAEHGVPARVAAPPALPPRRDEPAPIRRRRREQPVDALAICGFVASLVLSCYPLGAIPAALVGAGLCVFSLTQPRGYRGLAIAGLSVGTVAVVVSGAWLLTLLRAELNRPAPDAPPLRNRL